MQGVLALTRKVLTICVSLMCLIAGSSISQAQGILIDGIFDEWTNRPITYQDPAGDQFSGSLDFQRLWISNDDDFLLMNLEIGEELLMQQFNTIILHIDVDNDASTGTLINGIGADLEWQFGSRSGTFRWNGQTAAIGQSNIGVVTAPTVSANRFEIALEKESIPISGTTLFPGETIRLVFEDSGAGEDMLPDAGSTLTYSFTDTATIASPVYQLPKATGSDLRIVSYNVLNDGPFDAVRATYFSRLIPALSPDIFAFQEIYSNSASETAALVEGYLPSGSGQQWYSAKVNPDIITVSRYPIAQTFALGGNGAFLLDLRPQFDSELLLIVAHPPCCENDVGRQLEIDQIMAFVRDAKSSGGDIDLEANTPIVIAGDMNLVGDAQQLSTLLTGDIVNQGTYGQPFDPDWDDTSLEDLSPVTTNLPMTYTWHNDFSSFSPGKLDYIVYSGSVLTPVNSYVLFTQTLPADSLTTYNLLAGDATSASDHLPVIGDFVLNMDTQIDNEVDQSPQGFILKQNYPNPFNPATTIEYYLGKSTRVHLKIYDTLGREIATLVDTRQSPGWHLRTWDGLDVSGKAVPSGLYYYQLTVGGARQTNKLLLIR